MKREIHYVDKNIISHIIDQSGITDNFEFLKFGNTVIHPHSVRLLSDWDDYVIGLIVDEARAEIISYADITTVTMAYKAMYYTEGTMREFVLLDNSRHDAHTIYQLHDSIQRM